MTSPFQYCGNSPMMYVDPDGEFVLSFLSGFARGLFKKGRSAFKSGWQSVKNTAKINAGLFRGNFWQTISRLTWQAPQTILGYTIAKTINHIADVKVGHYAGATTISTNNWTSWGAFTLSSFIVGSSRLEANPDNSLFQHEYGHYLQSQAAGPIYLSKYALPSLYDAMKGKNNDNWDHDLHPVEQDANRRALKYFEKKSPGFVKSERWDFDANPIVGWDKDKNYDDPVNQNALKGAKMKAYSGNDIALFPLSIITVSWPYYDWQGITADRNNKIVK